MDENYTEDAPLGAEDAGKREDVGAVFVDVRELIPQTNLHTRDIKAIRVVVGRKGSGKTHILRYIEEAALEQREVVFCALSDNTVPARLESQFAKIVDRPHARSRWSKFWRIIFSITILSRFIQTAATYAAKRATSRFLNEQGYDAETVRATEWSTTRQRLLEYFEELYFPASGSFKISNLRHNRNPASLIHTVLESIHSIETLDRFIDKVDIMTLEADVASLAKTYRPFHLIIDGVDDVSWRQPRTWLDFQVGLFDAVFFFNEAQRSSEQVVVTVAIRNFVFQAAAESPHIDRVRNLLSLNWSPESAREFLNRRLRQIATGQFADATKLTSQRPLAEWLGFKDIIGIRRSKPEAVETYFLRHTRLSPRNTIRLFNALCQEKNNLLARDSDFGPEQFRRIVDRMATEVADLMLKTAAEEIIAFVGEISRSIATNTHAEGVLVWVASVLEDAIRAVGCEVIEWTEYRRFINAFLDGVLPDGVTADRDDPGYQKILLTVEAILWRSNVIAFWDHRGAEPRWSFSWLPRDDSQPKPGGMVGFHSSLIGKCHLEVSEHGPVF